MTAPALADALAPLFDLPALQRGEAEAVAQCYREHAGRLLLVLERFTTSRADAEDVVHDVFVQLPSLLRQYDDRGQFGPWLTRVAIRQALMQSRRAGRSVRLEEAPEPAVDTSPRDVAALRLAHDAVAALPAPLRHVLVLRVMLELPHAEIAAWLGISVGTSEVRFHRAIKQLRTTLGRAG